MSKKGLLYIFTFILFISASSTLEMAHEDIFLPIVDEIRQLIGSTSGPIFIAVAGCTASGKTHFSNILKEMLEANQLRVAILHGDDFLDPDHTDSEGFHPNLKHDLMHQCIMQIKQGATEFTKPIWNSYEFWPPAKIEETFSVKDVDIVIFDEEFALCCVDPYGFSKYSELGIFLDAADEDLLKWNWERQRDVKEGESKDDFLARTKVYMGKYRAYLQSSMAKPTYKLLQDAEHQYICVDCRY